VEVCVTDAWMRAQAEDKGLPHNLDAEQALLGALLYDNGALENLPDYFGAQHFYEGLHHRLYAMIEEKVRKGLLADPATLNDAFAADPAFDEVGPRYLAELVHNAPPAVTVRDYARTVHDLAVRRELIRFAGETAQSASSPEGSAKELIEGAESALYALAETGERTGHVVSFGEAVEAAVETAILAASQDGGVSGLSTGLIDVDRQIGGLHRSDLIILAGRPSMGKTALATNIAYRIARDFVAERLPSGEERVISGGRVAFYSLEMSAEQLGARVLADVSGISGDRIRKGQIDRDEIQRLRDLRDELREIPMTIDATGGLSIAKLCARARRLKRRQGLELIVVDYLQLATTGRKDGNRVQEVSEITQALKALAKELDVPVIALSQLSRQVEQREDKRPQLSDLRESGSIEQDADVVAFVYREAYYLGRTEPKENTPEHAEWCDELSQCRGVAELIIGKQRHGPIGTVKLSFDENTTRFGNLARDGRYDSYSYE
jgi:replicative DNA helicase